jgi:hypothetical protein
MNRLSFSIARILMIVAIAALGFAAIRVASPGWAGGMFSVTILAMLTSILGIAFRRGSPRVFWIGFALFGWANLILVHAFWFDRNVGVYLLGAKLGGQIFPVVHPAAAGGFGGMGGGMGGGGFRSLGLPAAGVTTATASYMGGGAGPAVAVNPVNYFDFVSITQSLEALFWAFIGGWTARYLSSRRDNTLVAASSAGP